MLETGAFDWNDVHHFLACLRARTLSGAARSLGVEHSTISRRLAALEKALGAPLFTRGADGLSPTPLAERLAPYAEDIERSVTALLDSAASQKTRVRLAVPSAFAQFITPHL